jgi:hypothetical protein
MATKAKKTASKPAKTTHVKAGADPAIAARSKDAKPAFGKAAPKRVTPTTAKATKAKSQSASSAAREGTSAAREGTSIAAKVARTVKTTANVAVGAVVATAKGAATLASSAVGKSGTKAGSRAKAK